MFNINYAEILDSSQWKHLHVLSSSTMTETQQQNGVQKFWNRLRESISPVN